MPRMDRHATTARSRNLRAKRAIVVAGFLLLLLVVTGAAYYFFSGFGDKMREGGSIATPQHKVNIMVMGVDERNEDVGRSDTLFAMTIDTKTKEVAMLSIPRDTRVKIPGKGWDKINHAYGYGGAQLTQKSVESLLGIKIDHVVQINIAGFQKIIDAIGGVTIDVEKRMYYTDPYDDDGGLVIDLKPGVQRMDGKTAIKYVRYRDEEGDIGRVERQQKFMRAVMQEVTSPKVITKVPAIIREVSSMLKTDMSTSEMLGLAKILNDAGKSGLKTDMVPGKPAFIDEISYWLPDLVALRQHVAQTLGVTIEERYMTATQKEASEYEKSLPKEVKIVEPPARIKQQLAKTTEAAADKNKPADKNTATSTKTADTKPAGKPSSGKVRVEVVNSSGMPEVGEKVVNALRSQGFEVISLNTSGSIRSNTVVVANSSAAGRMGGLPFRHSLQATGDDNKNSDAVIYIGKDYK